MISLYRDLIKGNHPIKRFHLLIFLFSQIKQRRNSNRLHICTIFGWKIQKKEASSEALFSRYYSLNPLMNFKMTLVSDSPHVASLLRINISKLGCALQANFMLRYSPHVASLLRINISKFGCALQAYLTKSYRKRAHSSLRLGLLDSSPDPLHAELLLR